MDTHALNHEYRQQKTRLTRAVNVAKRAPSEPAYRKVIAECRAFADYYNDANLPLPDDWARWQRAEDDARLTLTYWTRSHGADEKKA